MTEQETETLKTTKNSSQTGITLRLGPDSKLSLPIQGGNLLMMLVIAGQLFFKFANLPEDVNTIGKDIDQIQVDLEGLKTQGTDRDRAIGAHQTKIEILNDEVESLKSQVSDLKSAKATAETQIEDLEKENDKLVTCVRRPSKCRL